MNFLIAATSIKLHDHLLKQRHQNLDKTISRINSSGAAQRKQPRMRSLYKSVFGLTFEKISFEIIKLKELFLKKIIFKKINLYSI